MLGLTFLTLAAPPVTVACSCAMSDDPMREAAGNAEVSVFTGVAGPLEPDGVRVRLTRWFHGPPPPSGIAVLDPAGFVDPMGGSCGTNPPGVGAEWIFVLGRNDVGRFGMSLCSTASALKADRGQELLTEAMAVFGPPIVPDATAPQATEADATSDPSSTLGSVLPLGLGLLAAIVVVAGLFGLAGRRRRDEG